MKTRNKILRYSIGAAAVLAAGALTLGACSSDDTDTVVENAQSANETFKNKSSGESSANDKKSNSCEMLDPGTVAKTMTGQFETAEYGGKHTLLVVDSVPMSPESAEAYQLFLDNKDQTVTGPGGENVQYKFGINLITNDADVDFITVNSETELRDLRFDDDRPAGFVDTRSELIDSDGQVVGVKTLSDDSARGAEYNRTGAYEGKEYTDLRYTYGKDSPAKYNALIADRVDVPGATKDSVTFRQVAYAGPEFGWAVAEDSTELYKIKMAKADDPSDCAGEL